MTTTHADTQQALAVSVAADVPVCLWGSPGEGKTSTVEAIAQAYGFHLETLLLSLREPADLAGMPVFANGETILAPPSWAKRLVEADGNGLLFLDELSTAVPSVQAAGLRVVLDRVVGDLRLPKGTRVICAANPPEQAADGWDLAPPMANRMVHLDWKIPAEAVRDGFSMGWTVPEIPQFDQAEADARIQEAKILVGSFLGAQQSLVSKVPTSDSEKGRAYPTPRSWDMAAKLYGTAQACGARKTTIRTLMVGTVGLGAANEFLTFVKELDLPDPEQVLANPESLTIPQRGDRAYAVGASVLSAVVANNTPDRWQAAGTVFAMMADAGLADVAVALGFRWMQVRPDMAIPSPLTTKALIPILSESKLLKNTGRR